MVNSGRSLVTTRRYINGEVQLPVENTKHREIDSHDLLIAKLRDYGFSKKTVNFIYSYLKRRKQNEKIENFYSDFLTLLSEVVSQGSILSPIFFNLLLNDLLATLKMSELYNFVDHNTISTGSKNMSNLIQTLEKEEERAVGWFSQNKMIVNPDKFQAMLLEKRNGNKQSFLQINNQTIKTTNSVKLLSKVSNLFLKKVYSK